MKEFYFKDVDGELYFFYRNAEKNTVPRDIWIERCNAIEFDKIKKNNTFNELLKFLDLNQKLEYTFEDVKVTIWLNDEYKLMKFENQKDMKNPNYLANLGNTMFILSKVK